ncbi:SDR family oxidoreductase [Neisseria elongata]|uniref:SDR family NAD(P)-dependent oxidoreductase n=1 Tax=Neisseria elongata subsp. nitroreducens TaxID=90367 RepID=A0A9X0ZUR1_NEIEL|nr:SDR family NAD(P)-dependent oxidoreductase [Neisseria elongata]MBS9340874.1 SDR family NAD(P)-dependent oxidoreductase [Neisseria elongata subsp. nitroreducens]
MNLTDKKILLTGGSSGIGAALAEALHRRGAHVLTCARHLPEPLPDGITFRRCDLSLPAERDALAAWVRDEHPDTAVLINNAAVQRTLDFVGGERAALLQNLAQELAVNLEAPVALTAALLPVLASQPQAAVVNITTGLALAPKKSAPVYCAAKAGLHNFTRALRYQTEAAAPHIRVQEIVPPLVDTRMTAGRGSGKLSPEAVADAVVRAIESGRAETCIGKIRLLKWLLRLAPSAAYRILRNE